MRWFLVMKPSIALLLQMLVAGMAWIALFSDKSNLSGVGWWLSVLGFGYLQLTLVVNYMIYLDRWLGRRRAAKRAAEEGH